MKKTSIHTLYQPHLTDPIFIQGVSQESQSVHPISRHLIDHLYAQQFASLYSPYFPDYLIAKPDGLCTLPCFEFYASTQFVPHVVLLTGGLELLPEGAYANYEIFETVLNFATQLGCTKFIGYSYFTPDRVEDTLYIAATSDTLASQTARDFGGRVLQGATINSPTGLLLGLAHNRGLQGIYILKPIAGTRPSETASFSILKYLLSLLAAKE